MALHMVSSDRMSMKVNESDYDEALQMSIANCVRSLTDSCTLTAVDFAF